MAARRLEAAAPANESQALAVIFFLHLFRASRSIDVEVSVSCPCKVIPLSDEVAVWDMIKKVKTKRQVFPWKMVKNSWNPKQACNRSWPVLHVVRRSFNTHDLSGVVVYISLHSTMYTTQHNRQSRLDLCNCQFHGQSPIVRCLTIGVHETDSYTNLSDSVCCVQLLFLNSFIESRNWAP